MFTMKRVFICILFLFCATGAIGVQADLNVDSLRGIRRLFVSVDVDANSYDITSEQIRTEAALKLKMAGIGIADDLEDGDAAVYIEVKLIEEIQFVSVATSVYIFQRASLLRNDHEMYAITWRRSAYGYVGRQRIAGIRDQIGKLVDGLIDDHGAANR
jgi:hypothetical protein